MNLPIDRQHVLEIELYLADGIVHSALLQVKGPKGTTRQARRIFYLSCDERGKH